MSNASEFVEKLYVGDEVAAAAALSALTDPAAVAREVKRQLGIDKAVDEFTRSNPDIAADVRLAGVADMMLVDATGGRDFSSLTEGEAREALATAGRRCRDWLQRVVPRAASEQREQAEPSAIIAQMRKARGQA